MGRDRSVRALNNDGCAISRSRPRRPANRRRTRSWPVAAVRRQPSPPPPHYYSLRTQAPAHSCRPRVNKQLPSYIARRRRCPPHGSVRSTRFRQRLLRRPTGSRSKRRTHVLRFISLTRPGTHRTRPTPVRTRAQPSSKQHPERPPSRRAETRRAVRTQHTRETHTFVARHPPRSTPETNLSRS